MKESQIVKMVKGAYDKIAQNYQESYEDIDEQDWQHWNTFILSCKGEKVLDMGCGTGGATRYLLGQGLIPYGIDFSEKMLNIAKKQSSDIVWNLGDICNCPYEDKSFKGIVVSYTINHFDDVMLNKLKKEIDRLLDDEGLLLLMYHVGNGEEISKDPVDKNISIYFHYFQKEYLCNLFLDYEEIDYYQRQSVGAVELLNDKAILTLCKNIRR